MSRETDIKLELSERTQASNAFGVNIFVSIHNNAGYAIADGIISFINTLPPIQ